jgi:hypothetical protein
VLRLIRRRFEVGDPFAEALVGEDIDGAPMAVGDATSGFAVGSATSPVFYIKTRKKLQGRLII